MEQAQLEALINAPKAELKARLDAIAELPAHVLWRARFAMYAAAFVGMLSAPFSAARAQTKTGGTEDQKNLPAEVKETLPTASVSGFVQMSSDLTEPTFDLGPAWVTGAFAPHRYLDSKVAVNVTGPTLLEAYGNVKFGEWPFYLKVGQFAQKSAYLVPPPHHQRLIGGPEAIGLVTLQDIGLEIGGTHEWASWSLAVISGAGKNVPDNNASKDVLAWFAAGPFGPLSFQLTWQGGEQPEGFRMRTAGEAKLQLSPITLSLVLAHELAGADEDSEGARRFAASSMLAWRAHEHLDLAVGYDAVAADGADVARTLRAQTTFLTLEDRLRLGIMYRYQISEDEHGAVGRVQVNF